MALRGSELPLSHHFHALSPFNTDLSSPREDVRVTLRGLWGMGSAAADVSGNPICPCPKGYMSQNRKCLEQCLGITYKLELYIARRDFDHMQFTHGVLGCHY